MGFLKTFLWAIFLRVYFSRKSEGDFLQSKGLASAGKKLSAGPARAAYLPSALIELCKLLDVEGGVLGWKKGPS